MRHARRHGVRVCMHVVTEHVCDNARCMHASLPIQERWLHVAQGEPREAQGEYFVVGCQSHGARTHWSLGACTHWSLGARAHWSLGVRTHWSLGALTIYMMSCWLTFIHPWLSHTSHHPWLTPSSHLHGYYQSSSML